MGPIIRLEGKGEPGRGEKTNVFGERSDGDPAIDNHSPRAFLKTIAQDEQRSRIATDLHDHIGQRISLMAAELEQLQENPSQASQRFVQ